MSYIKTLLFLLFISFNFIANAQTSQTAIHLKNGEILKGQIIEEDETSLKVEIFGGSVFVIKKTEIEKMEKHDFPKNLIKKRNIIVNTKGFYHATNLGFLFGLDRWDDIIVAYSLQYTFGYQFNKNFGLGIGTGIDTYNANYGFDYFQPIYLETRGFFTNRTFSPYYTVQLGYSNGDITNRIIDIDLENGSLFFHPKLGLRFPTRKKAALTVEVGYTLQQINYFGFRAWHSQQTWRMKSYNRATLRFGILF